MNIKILVATHKNYEMPADSDLYLPVFVGKDLHPDVNHTFIGDNTGDNISKKNAHYNELTAIYWAWKNLKNVDAIGLVHYRRYLSLNHHKNLNEILTKKDIEKLFTETNIILPKKRNYFIESNFSHYIHAHHQEPLDLTRQIIAKDYPSYLGAYDKVMNSTSAHMFNMFIMRKKYFDWYCNWLFDILGKVEDQLDISDYDTYEARVYGFISELLLDTWITANHYDYKEVNFVYMEKQNWLKKGSNFLARKLEGTL
ncbi:glycosyltransferase [Lactobacillus selangorensis]|uniref:Glycosyltransferase n=1 Tax=Lactobacillus selangorensis TaxID=81857 RepID=A0A0R2FI81_9LACO|nr:DUF4422 domain-containing protein [Lactobacillus selangorensis]KRN28351.1 glycosyltransferase [Lactobacillus selangorensis]KRN31853.1 glycosyltransferase [Lactobacillus selangorensis]